MGLVSMRHVMVHGYYTIKHKKVWETIIEDIPPMIPVLEKYLKEFDS